MKTFIDEDGDKWEVDKEFTDFLISRNSGPEKVIRPVKKTEDKTYTLLFQTEKEPTLLVEYLELTPTTANKLSEAISALVEWIQTESPTSHNPPELNKAIREAKESYQESQ